MKNTELFTEQFQNIEIYTEQFHASMPLLFQNTEFYTEAFLVFIQENKKQKKLIDSCGRPPLRLLSIIYELNDNFLLRLVNTEYMPLKSKDFPS